MRKAKHSDIIEEQRVDGETSHENYHDIVIHDDLGYFLDFRGLLLLWLVVAFN
jgi:hypothetical protein